MRRMVNHMEKKLDAIQFTYFLLFIMSHAVLNFPKATSVLCMKKIRSGLQSNVQWQYTYLGIFVTTTNYAPQLQALARRTMIH